MTCPVVREGGKGGHAPRAALCRGRHLEGRNAEFGNSAASGVDVINYRYHRHICTEKCNTVKLLVKERGKAWAYSDLLRIDPRSGPLNVPPVLETANSTALEVHLHPINSRLVGRHRAVVSHRSQQIILYTRMTFSKTNDVMSWTRPPDESIHCWTKKPKTFVKIHILYCYVIPYQSM